MRSVGTVRTRDDWPNSALSSWLRFDPSESNVGSPEALRNGKIASETGGPVGADGAVLNSESRQNQPATATATRRPATRVSVALRSPLAAGARTSPGMVADTAV